ncbi:hypothetical protein K8O68_07050 [Salipaludibacillus sp. CUR1]|uniref:tubby C-terminal domain-like protein n=1 Tax=Salipaludibacillus sp. CUR1 TaxID=2820003 RepID=UPI001E3AFB7E|nr:hypothetical protein [Salipaludibacillus sp. CUR1]MCE7792181.1 hypothetical protein [Salipaludibacillus sp. CUR1]
MLNMKFKIPIYKHSVKEVDVFKEDEKLGTMQRYNKNPFIHRFGRHISHKLIANIRVTEPKGNTVKYDISADNPWQRMIKMGTFSIYDSHSLIGHAGENRKLGVILNFSIGDKKYRAFSKIKELRKINFYNITGDSEIHIGAAERTLNPAVNEMNICLNEDNDLAPLLVAGLCYLHTMI